MASADDDRCTINTTAIVGVVGAMSAPFFRSETLYTSDGVHGWSISVHRCTTLDPLLVAEWRWCVHGGRRHGQQTAQKKKANSNYQCDALDRLRRLENRECCPTRRDTLYVTISTCAAAGSPLILLNIYPRIILLSYTATTTTVTVIRWGYSDGFVNFVLG